MKKITHYLPRVLAVLIVLFFGVFILEGFGPGFGWQDLISHLLPTLIVLAITIMAWKRPKIGGWLFIGMGVFAGLFFHPFIFNGLAFGGVFALTGILFLADGGIFQS